MTTLKRHLPLFGIGFGLATIIYPVAVFVVGTLDLTVVVPLLYYGLLVRRNRSQKEREVPFERSLQRNEKLRKNGLSEQSR